MDKIVALLNETLDCSGEIYIWGAGNSAALYQEGFERFPEFDFVGYVDNNRSKWDTFFFNKKVYSPEHLLKVDNPLVLIVSFQTKVVKAVGRQLDAMKIRWCHIDEYIFKQYKERVLECYNLLEDDFSKKVYTDILECRMFGKNPAGEIVDTDMYFSHEEFGIASDHEVFVDCGAYVGDSIEEYIWKRSGVFGKIIAFEPDDNNKKAMGYRIERLKREWNISDEKFEIYPYGVGEKTTTAHLKSDKISSQIISSIADDNMNDTRICKIVAIDDFMNEKYDFLKADIESYEYKLLLGARETIIKYQPKISVCIYHSAFDYFSIMLLLHKINPNYKFAVRHYTYKLSDTILYAWIES